MIDIWNLLGAIATGGRNPALGATIKKTGPIAEAMYKGRPGQSKPGGGGFEGGHSRRNSTAPWLNRRFPDILREDMQPQRVAPNPLDQLLQIMQGMLGQQGPSYEPNYDDLMSQIEGQVNPVYDARASAIEQLMGRATERTKSNRADVEGMYNQLSQDYGQDAIAAQAKMEQARAEAEALQGTLKKNIKGTYSRVAEEQADLFQKLGIEEAAPEVLGPQGEDQAFLESLADTRGTASQDFYKQLGATDQAYYAQGAPLAKLEGSNRSADLMAQLEDYLSQSQAGLTELEGQRSSDIIGAFNQLAMQAQQFAQQQSAQSQGNQWGQLQDMFGNLMQMGYGPQQQQDVLGTQSQMISTQLGLAPQENSQFQNAIAEIGSDPSMLYGQTENPRTGEQVPTNRNQVMQLIRQYAREKGLSGRVENALAIWAEQVYK